MNPYVLVPLLGCVASTTSACVIWLRDPTQRNNRIAGLLVGCAAWWAFCQVLWTMAPDAGAALRWHKLGALGWAWLGPLALALVSDLTGERWEWVRRALPALFLGSAAVAVLELTTRLLHSAARPAPWGWTFEVAPGFLGFFVFALGCGLPAAVLGLRRIHSAPSPAERRQLGTIAVAVATPLVLSVLTGLLLPWLGIPTPRLGPVSFSVLGAIVAWSYQRYGFSALTPGSLPRDVLEALADGVALVQLDGRVLSANGALARLAGRPADELQGVAVEALLDAPLFEQASGAPERTPRELRELECRLDTASGEQVPVAVSVSDLRDKRRLAIGLVLVVRDLREVVDLRNRLLTSGRLAAVGQLAAGIAHEINNPTSWIRANLNQLRSTWERLSKWLPARGSDAELDGLVDEVHDLIDESVEGVEHTAAVVRAVRGFAQRGTGVREPVDLNVVVRDVLRIAQPHLSGHIDVSVALGDVPTVPGSPQELRQVLLNLLMNARQAIEGEGAIRISTRREGDRACVEVADDGCGIAAEDLERIFDPFFTTREEGEGTGLGLAISYEIARAHGGELLAESNPGQGTRITLSLPLAAAPAPAGAAEGD